MKGRVEELEKRSLRQEDQLIKLDQVLQEQHHQIDLLKKKLINLTERLEAMEKSID